MLAGVVSDDIFADVDTLIGGAGDDFLFAGYGDHIDGGSYDSFGNRLFISFQGAKSGVVADFRPLQNGESITIGGGTISNIQNIGFLEGSEYDDFIASIDTYYPSGADIFGRGGNDTIIADYYSGWGGAIWGGDGDDTIDATGAQYGARIYGEAGNDVIRMNYGTADGGDGDDTIYGGSAFGGAGNDRLIDVMSGDGGDGDDIITLNYSYYGNGIANGGRGDDLIRATDYGSVLVGGEGADELFGGADADLIYTGDRNEDGSALADVGVEKDIVSAGAGADRICAGVGDDVDGGDGADTLYYSFGGATTGVDISTHQFLGATAQVIGGGTIISIEILAELRASSFDDRIVATTQDVRLSIYGGAGNDVVTSSGSSITFRGEEGDDRLISGEAADIFIGGFGTDTIDYSLYTSGVSVTLGVSGAVGTGGGGDSLISVENVVGSAFSDDIQGNELANMLEGGAGNDILNGGAGDDRLVPGTGHNMVDGGDGFDTLVLTGGVASYSYLVSGASTFIIGEEGASRIVNVDHVVFANGALGSADLAGSLSAFDGLRYIAGYGDLIAAFASDANGATAHYASSGFAEGRDAKEFDPLDYIAGYDDLIAAFGTDTQAATRHYIDGGFVEGRSDDLFDGLTYIASYGDLIEAFGTDADAGARHFIQGGRSEGRSDDLFDGLQYVASYGDLIAAIGTDVEAAVEHFIKNGYGEGRMADDFDGLRYIASNPDLIVALGDDDDAAARHYILAGRSEGRDVDGFDALAYAAANADLAAAFGTDILTLTTHYIDVGYFEGRSLTAMSSADMFMAA